MQPTSTPALPYGIPPSEHRLPDATRLGRVRLQIANLARSIEYYQRVLGLRLLESTETTATLGVQHDSEPLVELHERLGATPSPQHGRLGLYHFAILLPDRPSLGRFIRHLASIGERAGMADHAVSEAVYLTDPDGLGIEVYADRPRSEWRHKDRELLMTTDPIDVQSVVRSAGDTQWDGMPKGSVIGHVHLHVAEIDEATRFYHHGVGFDKVVWSYPGALFLSAGGYHHHLGTNTWAARAPQPKENDAQLLEWEIVVPDAEAVSAAAANLEKVGYAVDWVDGDVVVRDPWGTTLRVTVG